MDTFTIESQGLETEIADMRKRVNETEVEAQLHIQYRERKLKGDQDCESRQHEKIEKLLEQECEQLLKELATEKTVNAAITEHLTKRRDHIREQKTELEGKSGELAKEEIEKQIADIKDAQQKAEEDNQNIQTKLNLDFKEKQARDDKEQARLDEERQKLQKKMEMDDAARAIQAKWAWF